MKLRILASRNPSAIYRYPTLQDEDEEQEERDPLTPLDNPPEQTEQASREIPQDTGNRLPTGGRTGKPKIDKFQGYRVPPMY